MSDEVSLSDFPSTDFLILCFGYKSPAVFAVFRIEPNPIKVGSPSPTAIAQIKSVAIFNKCPVNNFYLKQAYI